MAQGWTNTLANDALIRASSMCLFIGLNQGDPGASGANEINVGSYDRRPPSWQAPASGQLKILSTGVPMRVPGACSVGFWTLWNQATQGTCMMNGSFTTSENFVNPGTYTVQSLNVAIAIV